MNEVIKGRGNFPHREKDEGEVRHYYRALEKIEQMAPLKGPIEEDDLKLLHGIAFMGKSKSTPYRDGQNVIRSGKLVVYIPPKSEDVPLLMAGLVCWIQDSVQQNLPIPFIKEPESQTTSIFAIVLNIKGDHVERYCSSF